MRREDHILLAEDNPDDALLIQAALQKVGVLNPVHVVTSRSEVIGYFKGEGRYADRKQYPLPTLVLLALLRPLLNDFAALRWIRQHHEFDNVHVAIFSGMDYEEEARVALELGADCYRAKPCRFDELVETCKQIRDRWRAKGNDRAAA